MRKKEDLCCKYREGKIDNMKYTTENALNEIKRRARRIKREHNRKVTRLLASSASLCLIALFAVISAFSDSQVFGAQSEYGAFILPAETGGYVLVAVIGFTLGILITLLINRLKRKNFQLDP